MSRMNRKRMAAVIAVVSALMLTACGAAPQGDQGDPGPSARQKSDSLVVLAEQDPGTLDYTTSVLTALRRWIPNVVEPLVSFDRDGNATGAVAESWKISEDGRTYDFTIRQGIRFSNGQPVTTDDVVYSLDVMRKSSLSEAAVYARVASIAKTGDRVVRIVLREPSRTFWEGMGGIGAFIQPESEAATIATKPIGTGPYMVESYVSNGALKLVANPHYWGTPPGIKSIDISIVTDGTARINAMKAGEADLYVPIREWDQAVQAGLDKRYAAVTDQAGGEPQYVVVNEKLDPRLRRAIAYAVDPRSLSRIDESPWKVEESCTFATQDRAWWQPASADTCPYAFDLKAASDLVAEGGFGAEPITFVGISDVPYPGRDLLIANLKAIGLDVQVENPDLARYSQTIFSSDSPEFDVTMMAGPDSLTQWLCPNGKASWSTYCSPEYDALLAEADRAATTEEYNRITAKAVALLQKDAVVITYGSPSIGGLMDKHLSGWSDPRVPKSVDLASLRWDRAAS